MDFITDMINEFGVIPVVVFAAIIVFIIWMFVSKKGPGASNGSGGNGNSSGTGTGAGTGTPPTTPQG